MASMSTERALSSSPSSSDTPRWTYDVFLSFRGEDTRNNFTDHLFDALKQKGIFTFRDDEKLERGQSISLELEKAIEESRFAIVIFSRNYASSTWCLEELAKIVGCMKVKGMTVLPIFYNVDPSDVRKQKRTFAQAFVEHEERFKENMKIVQTWRDALIEVANLSGWDLKDRPETKLIQEIVGVILNNLSSFPTETKGLVGINPRVKKLISHLDIGSSNVRIIGIWGLGGIGKTTLAEVVYEMVSNQFEACGFIRNVREVSKNIDGLLQLQKTLLNQLLKIDVNIHDDNTGVHMIKNRLRHKKILLVLDDVNDFNQLEKLAGENDWFGPGSRVIITTRDEHLLKSREVDGIYEAKVLNYDESFHLFNLKAFKKEHPTPTEDYLELSQAFVHYADGLPLAIEVLGSFLFNRSIGEWKSELDKLKKFPERKILNVLQISFDGLDQTKREIFLNIACFFNHENRDSVEKILDYLELYPTIGLQVLIEKSLLKLHDNQLWMHDLLQEMGRDIIHQENCQDPGKRSRLWLYKDINSVLTENTGTKAVQGIVLNLFEPKKVDWNPEGFSKMQYLKLLKISGVQLIHDLKHLPNSLRYLDWRGCPLKSLPSSFQSNELIELCMCYSNIERLWKGTKSFEKLKFIYLDSSHKLIETPDFTEIPNLEELVFEDCINLRKIHPSIGDLTKLTLLNLKGCSKVKKIPEFGGNMECVRELYLDGTAITKLPATIGLLKNLKRLSLEGCKGLSYELIPFYSKPISPDPVGLFPLLGLCSLTQLNLRDCNLKAIPNDIGSLFSLEYLYLNGNKLVCLPESIGQINRMIVLDLRENKLKCLPKSIGQLSQLEKLDLRENKLKCLPESIGQLSRLEELDLAVNNLKCLPESLCQLSQLFDLDLHKNNLKCLPESLGQLTRLDQLHISDNDIVGLPKSLGQLTRLLVLDVRYCTYLKSLPKLPLNLYTIHAKGCKSLEMFPDLSRLKDAPCLNLQNCFKLSENQGYIDNFIACMERRLQCQGFSNRYPQIVIPGSEIPEWFSHQSMGPEVNIKLHYSHLCNDFMGIALCVVLSFDATPINYIEWSFIVNGNEIQRSLRDYGNKIYIAAGVDITTIASDHILLSYSSTTNLRHKFSKSLVEYEANGFCQIGIRFKIFYNCEVPFILRKEVKKCGVRLFYKKHIEDPIPTTAQCSNNTITLMRAWIFLIIILTIRLQSQAKA